MPDQRILAAPNPRIRRCSDHEVGTGLTLFRYLAVSATGWAVLLVRRRQRNRFRIPPAEVMRLVDGPDPPIILDVRASDAYARSPVRIPRSLHLPLDSLADGAATVPADPSRTVVAYCT